MRLSGIPCFPLPGSHAQAACCAMRWSKGRRAGTAAVFTEYGDMELINRHADNYDELVD